MRYSVLLWLSISVNAQRPTDTCCNLIMAAPNLLVLGALLRQRTLSGALKNVYYPCADHVSPLTVPLSLNSIPSHVRLVYGHTAATFSAW